MQKNVLGDFFQCRLILTLAAIIGMESEQEFVIISSSQTIDLLNTSHYLAIERWMLSCFSVGW